MELTINDIINELEMLRPVVINEQYANARIYYVPIIKDGKIFVGYYTNRTLMYDEYRFARVNIINPVRLQNKQDAIPVQLIKRKQEEYDEVIILEVKEIMYDKLKIYSNHFIRIGAYLNFMEN